jgi:hypothetical protein
MRLFGNVQRDVDVIEEIASGMEAGACFGFVLLYSYWWHYDIDELLFTLVLINLTICSWLSLCLKSWQDETHTGQSMWDNLWVVVIRWPICRQVYVGPCKHCVDGRVMNLVLSLFCPLYMSFLHVLNFGDNQTVQYFQISISKIKL